MSCQQVQTNLSLYLYGELDFAQEEAVEQHLDGCAFCQRALAREKEWHGTLKAEHVDVPLGLLSECRSELSGRLISQKTTSEKIGSQKAGSHAPTSWWKFAQGFGFGATRWSLQLAAASFLLFAGFSGGRLLTYTGGPADPINTMGVLGSPTIHVRDIQPDGNNGVHLIIDRVTEQQVSGRVDDGDIRRILLSAMEDPSDPGIRVYSLEVLKGQRGSDIRDALLRTARLDSNAAVRLKAIEGLRQFSPDIATVETLKYVLEHDEDPGVRSEAIDILASAGQGQQIAPSLAGTLQEIARSKHADEYVRSRCMQLLRQMNAPIDVY